MTHYNISYSSLPRAEAEEKATHDILQYLGNSPAQICLFGDLIALATCIEHEIPTEGKVQKFSSLNMTFGFAGISGYPFHAFCRRYCPAKYREWMMGGEDPIALDNDNFPITEAKQV